MPSPALRLAKEHDVGVLLEMMDDFNRCEVIAWEPATTELALRKLLKEPTLGQVVVVEDEGVIRGYAVLTYGYDLEFAGRDAYLTELYLRPEARGQGLGKWLLARVEERAHEAGVQAVHLMVRPENEPALKLYRRAGFEAPPRVFLTKRLPPER
ncbi:GNAT family N-acetyltransferase [Hyalangium sp.]|uniref:GNAT family N-acetyltransferase n=1 Tax=Hyalangium sp. TaxID=2028555 RepID=UPI002D30BA42|nr:GNAT family N-acetyltransferase [Hyalangium sp.]HYH94589.1 GNAT family N-acetyltransferase [Hyalangium sp.]